MAWFRRQRGGEPQGDPEGIPRLDSYTDPVPEAFLRKVTSLWLPEMLRNAELREAERRTRGIPATVHLGREQITRNAENLSRRLDSATAEWGPLEALDRRLILGMYVSNQTGTLPPGSDGFATEYRVSRWYLDPSDPDDGFVQATAQQTKNSVRTTVHILRQPTEAQAEMARLHGVRLLEHGRVGYEVSEIHSDGWRLKHHYGGETDTADAHEFASAFIDNLPGFVES
jgi:hypothetical protein